MKMPMVLDREKTCFTCSHHPLCHGRLLVWDFVLRHWNGHMGTSNSLALFVALAAGCKEFDYSPDPPLSKDDPLPPFTVVIQVRGRNESVIRLGIQEALAGDDIDADVVAVLL